jgi:hypothetical protein
MCVFPPDAILKVVCVYIYIYLYFFIEHILTLVPVDDGLKHRPQAEWSIMYMNCELNDAEIWLKSALQEEPGKEVLRLLIWLFVPFTFSSNFLTLDKI